MYGVCVCDDDGSPCQRHSIELIIGIRPGPSGVQSVVAAARSLESLIGREPS